MTGPYALAASLSLALASVLAACWGCEPARTDPLSRHVAACDVCSRQPDPDDPARGTAPLAACREALRLAPR